MFLYGPYSDVDSGDWRGTGQSFWGVNGGSSTITDPNHIVSYICRVVANESRK